MDSLQNQLSSGIGNVHIERYLTRADNSNEQRVLCHSEPWTDYRITQSVALVISTSRQLWLNTSILETNKHNMPRKIGKILIIFDKVDDSKGQRVPCQFNMIGVNTLDILQIYLSGTNNLYNEASVAEYTVYLFRIFDKVHR